MQKFLFIFRYIVKVAVATSVILFVIGFPVIATLFKPRGAYEKLFCEPSANIVLDMWHIESFEGGNSARKTFLDKLFNKFNKQNTGVFISLKVMDVEQYNINIQYSTPDIISFTNVCDGVENYLTTLPRTEKLSKAFIESVVYDDTIICYPYMLGRYCLISYNDNAVNNLCGEIVERKNKKIFPLGFSADVGSVQALASNNINYNSNAKIYNTQYDNYKAFLKKETTTILGSQRDVHRLKNREQNGTIDNLYYTYLDGYTDLVQYIGVTKTCKNIDIAKKFADYVLSDDAQDMLSSIGMFSVNKETYSHDYMKEWEDSVKTTRVPKLFGGKNV